MNQFIKTSFFGFVFIWALFQAPKLTASEKKITFDEALHACIDDLGNPADKLLSNGSIGPCRDFSKTKFGVLFRLRLHFKDDLRGSSFQSIKTRKFTLKGKKLDGANFRQAKIGRLIVAKSSLSFAKFDQAVLKESDFNLTKAESIQLLGANLHGSDFSFALVKNGNFEDAVITSSNIRSIECQGCIFKKAKLSQSQGQNGHFESATFEGAEIKFGQFENAFFQGANLREVDFSNGNLSGADLTNTDLTGAIFHNVNLKGADLSSFSGNEVKFRLAKFNSQTKLPFSKEIALSEYGMVFEE